MANCPTCGAALEHRANEPDGNVLRCTGCRRAWAPSHQAVLAQGADRMPKPLECLDQPKPAADPFLGWCLKCRQPTGSNRRDFCQADECQDEAADNFGRCYHCHDGDHDLCIEGPCQCPCPTPDQRCLAELRASAAAKLTPEERAALGII